MNIKVGLISLGCDKNRVESEYMLSLLAEKFTITQELEDADVVIINTCAFIKSAVQESIDTIMEASQSSAKIIVTGCLNMRYKEIAEQNLIPEVSAFVDNQHYSNICDVVYNVIEGGKITLKNKGITKPMTGGRILTTPMHYANIRIADGCNNACTYCAIPRIRGGYVAVSPAIIVDEVKRLIDDYNTKEFIMVAQDVSRYSYNDVKLVDLLDRIEDAGAQKIRLMYCYPEAVSEDLVKRFGQDPKLLPYIDMPLQHINDRILEMMNRKSRKAQILELLNKLHSQNVTVRSTFISGFPTETENEHKELVEFIKSGLIDFAGFFPYFREEGTKAYNFEGQLTQKVKNKRVSELRACQTDVCKNNAEKAIGKTLAVTFDYIDYDKNRFVGHTDRTHPENDPHIYFTSKEPIEMGETYQVKIIGWSRLDLKGQVQ